jgi:hypothetical protein
MTYNTLGYLKKEESKIFFETNKAHPELIWFREFYKIIQLIISTIPEKDDNESVEYQFRYILIITSAIKIMHTSNSIFNLICNGYYHQGMILLRSIQEEYHHLLFYIFHPMHQVKQRVNGDIKPNKINAYVNSSKYKHIPKEWKPQSDKNIEMYGILSSYVHPNIESLGSIMNMKDELQELQLKILPRYEKNSFNTVFSGFMLYLGNAISVLRVTYENVLEEAGILDDIYSTQIRFEGE